MTRLAVLLLSLAACQVDATPSSSDLAAVEAPSSSESFASALVLTLGVDPQGRLVIRDDARARELLGKDYAEAARELDLLDEAIARGVVPPFRDDAALLDYHLVADDAELTSAEAPAWASGRCRGSCLSGTCCVSGWWIFCWGYGTC